MTALLSQRTRTWYFVRFVKLEEFGARDFKMSNSKKTGTQQYQF